VVRLELHGSKEQQARRKFGDSFRPAQAATLRLVEPWFGSGRTVIGDAWFGSVSTIAYLRAYGLFGISMVKMGHSLFPRKQLLYDLANQGPGPLAGAPPPPRGKPHLDIRGAGRWVWREATLTGVRREADPGKPLVGPFPIRAVLVTDRSDKFFAASTGSTAEGTPREVKRPQVQIPRPKLMEEYFNFADVIDKFNHLRHGGPSLTREWVAQPRQASG
jgi:hypothetical protein